MFKNDFCGLEGKMNAIVFVLRDVFAQFHFSGNADIELSTHRNGTKCIFSNCACFFLLPGKEISQFDVRVRSEELDMSTVNC